MALEAIKAAEEKLAREVIMIDLKKNSSLADYLIICSGASSPQLKAISAEIEKRLKQKGIKTRREGEVSSGWMVLDYGSVVVHIFGQAERERYKLEELWGQKSVVYHV